MAEVFCRGPQPPSSLVTQTQDRGVQRVLDQVIYHTGMGHLSFRIPDSTEAAIDAMADEEGLSRSEIARELLIDGARLRTGAPVLIGDGGASLVSNVESIKARDNYMMATLLLLLGMLYAQMVLEGTAQLMGMTMLAVAGVAILVQFWRQ